MFIIQFFAILYARFFPGKPADYSFGMIEKMGILKDLQAKNWEALESKIIPLQGEDMTRFVDGLIFSNRYEAYVNQYLKASSSEVSILLKGCREIALAWKSRSAKLAQYVKNEQWKGFFEYLEGAWETLNHSFSAKNLQLEAYSRLIQVTMGYSDKEQMQEIFYSCMQADPTYVGAHLNYFKALTPKWLGSQKELKAYAFGEKDPALSTLLRLMFLTEMYAEMDGEYEDEAGKKSTFNQWYGNLASELFGELEIPTGEGHLSIHAKNHLAYLCHILRMKKRRDKLFSELGDRIAMFPWAYEGISTARDLRLYKNTGLL